MYKKLAAGILAAVLVLSNTHTAMAAEENGGGITLPDISLGDLGNLGDLGELGDLGNLGDVDWSDIFDQEDDKEDSTEETDKEENTESSTEEDTEDESTNTPPENGWYEEDGAKYWYENGVRQGVKYNEDGSIDESYRGKEIYDKESDGWYWLDGKEGGKMAVSKDVYQDSLAGAWGDVMGEDGQRYGKWTRYNAQGKMVKGLSFNTKGIYYFDETYGTMAKGYATIENKEYYFNKDTGVLEQEIGDVPEFGWRTDGENQYWYEGYVRQGYSVDENYRGKEIFDEASNAWYWLDNVDGGKKATSKDVYQDSLAGEWGDYVGEDGERYGKWVRYDENGHMIKGWSTNENGTYYFDETYGTMAKGKVVIEEKTYTFDEETGVLK